MVINPMGENKGAKARLETPQIPFISAGYCLSWYYHMLGPDIGKLNIYVKVQDRLGLFWSYGENIGDIWNGAELTIPKLSDYANFTILIEAEKGELALGAIAIDDLKLQIGACSSFGSCSFEEDNYCQWQNINDIRDNFDWEIANTDTASYGTGPT